MLPQKPVEVSFAQIALWLWTAWVCIFGLYHSHSDLTDLQSQIDNAAPGAAITVDPGMFMGVIAAFYAILAIASAWIIVRIGHGRRWARSSLMWGFLLQFLCDLFPLRAPL